MAKYKPGDIIEYTEDGEVHLIRIIRITRTFNQRYVCKFIKPNYTYPTFILIEDIDANSVIANEVAQVLYK